MFGRNFSDEEIASVLAANEGYAYEAEISGNDDEGEYTGTARYVIIDGKLLRQTYKKRAGKSGELEEYATSTRDAVCRFLQVHRKTLNIDSILKEQGAFSI